LLENSRRQARRVRTSGHPLNPENWRRSRLVQRFAELLHCLQLQAVGSEYDLVPAINVARNEFKLFE